MKRIVFFVVFTVIIYPIYVAKAGWIETSLGPNSGSIANIFRKDGTNVVFSLECKDQKLSLLIGLIFYNERLKQVDKLPKSISQTSWDIVLKIDNREPFIFNGKTSIKSSFSVIIDAKIRKNSMRVIKNLESAQNRVEINISQKSSGFKLSAMFDTLNIRESIMELYKDCGIQIGQ